MTEDVAKSFFTLAGFKIVRMYRLPNEYCGTSPAYSDYSIANPDWLIKTQYGLIKIGRRKRVWSIDWEDTDFRGKITQDDTTQWPHGVHAWTEMKVLEYLKSLCGLLSEGKQSRK